MINMWPAKRLVKDGTSPVEITVCCGMGATHYWVLLLSFQ